MIAGRRIVLGVTGGIAAYKAVEVCRRLVDAGAHVVPVMTKGAEHFIGRTTLSALASEPVQTSLWDEASPIPHTRLGQSADLVLVVPATARLLGAYAAGLSTDLLTNVLLATRAPVIVCPAMHTEMWEHPAVRDNLAHAAPARRARGRARRGPAGRAATSAPVGSPHPTRIVAEVERVLGSGDLAGLRVVVSAGGTREPIDAVRVIANRSSGKQGYAIAAEALSRGAARHASSSTVDLPTPRRVPTSAGSRPPPRCRQAMVRLAADADVVVMAAAVADFRPSGRRRRQDQEGRRRARRSCSSRRPTSSPASARSKPPDQTLVGFAAETADLRGQRRGQAAPQEPRPDRRQRCQRARRRVPARHQRGHAHPRRRRR